MRRTMSSMRRTTKVFNRPPPPSQPQPQPPIEPPFKPIEVSRVQFLVVVFQPHPIFMCPIFCFKL